MTVYPGIGTLVTDFEERGLDFAKDDEYASASYYRTLLHGKNGAIEAEIAASMCHLSLIVLAHDQHHASVTCVSPSNTHRPPLLTLSSMQAEPACS